MAITVNGLEHRRNLHLMNQLISRGWSKHIVRSPTQEQIRDRIMWCHNTFGPRVDMLDPVEVAQFGQWAATSVMGSYEIEAFLFAFREQSDYTMFLLKWE